MNKTKYMTFEEFDKRYNKCDKFGVVTHCAIIDIDGNIIFQDTPEEVENYYNNCFQNDVFEYHNDGKLYMGNVQLFGFTNIGKSLAERPEYKNFINNLK